MITPAYVQLMARYNTWQNRSIYRAAGGLSDTERRRDRGAFFGSIHATLSHLVFGDQIWMHRFAGLPQPRVKSIAESTTAFDHFDDMAVERVAVDHVIETWASELQSSALGGDLTWFSGAMQSDVTRPRWALVAHMFNHQTHHRGQVHAMMTAAGASPEATDIPFMPDASGRR